MKIFEREEMLINQGRQEQSVHTEFERKRAEAAEKRASAAEKEIQQLRERIRLLEKIGK